METELCCAYNVSRGRCLNSKVSVADSLLEPLKVLRLLVGLAIDAESSLWLTPLLYTPEATRLFPFDLVYLDRDLRVLHRLELHPQVPFPSFDGAVASALILPLHTLSSSGTEAGDQFVICEEKKLEAEIAKFAKPQVVEAVPSYSAAASAGAIQAPVMPAPAVPAPALPALALHAPIPFTSPVAPAPNHTAMVGQGAGFTVALTSTWQISNSTVSSMLGDVIEAAEQEGTTLTLAVPDTAVADVEIAKGKPEMVVREDVPILDTDLAQILSAEAAADSDVSALAISEMSAAEIESAQALSFGVEVAPVAEPVSSAATAEGEPTRPVLAESAVRIEATVAPVVEQREAQAPAREIPAKEAGPSRTKESAAKTAPAVTPAPSRTEKKSPEKKKEHLGNKVVRWLNLEEPPPERRKVIRLLLQGLLAYDAKGDGSKRYEVRDVCPNGFGLRAKENWHPGDTVSLVFEKKGATEKDHERRVGVPARVVRCDEDSVGLEFAFPEGTEFQPWKRAKTKRSDETEADFILRELRFARALGFLRRICPGAAEEMKHALQDRLSNKRVASAVEIALKAERSLNQNKKSARLLIHSDIAMRIIENGSWTEDDERRKMWAGLLASSCSADGLDTTNLTFIDLLAKLTPLHLRIFSFACRRGVEAIAAGESEAKLDLYATAEELMEASDSHSFPRIQQTIGHLSTFGLFAEAPRSSYAAITDKLKTRTTPTAMGLQMYARCNGNR